MEKDADLWLKIWELEECDGGRKACQSASHGKGPWPRTIIRYVRQ